MRSWLLYVYQLSNKLNIQLFLLLLWSTSNSVEAFRVRVATRRCSPTRYRA
jgi:hypothetical protein